MHSGDIYILFEKGYLPSKPFEKFLGGGNKRKHISWQFPCLTPSLDLQKAIRYRCSYACDLYASLLDQCDEDNSNDLNSINGELNVNA